VSPDKQIFHCFGCGAGGNVFSYVMKRDGLQYWEAARMKARR
jgi:DNA primase